MIPPVANVINIQETVLRLPQQYFCNINIGSLNVLKKLRQCANATKMEKRMFLTLTPGEITVGQAVDFVLSLADLKRQILKSFSRHFYKNFLRGKIPKNSFCWYYVFLQNVGTNLSKIFEIVQLI